MTLLSALMVACGGAIGALLRWSLGLLVTGPLLLLGINVFGSFLIGLCAGQLADRPLLGLFMLTGVLGGFTTFSAFSFETLKLIKSGQTIEACLFVLASVLLSIVAVCIGASLVRSAT